MRENHLKMTNLQAHDDYQKNSESFLLAKLQEIVPIMPRKELSKLEIINYVIDYIRELKDSLDGQMKE